MRAVSSVVEHLVYTEGVGGSKPSPPSPFLILDFGLAIYLTTRAGDVAGKIESVCDVPSFPLNDSFVAIATDRVRDHGVMSGSGGIRFNRDSTGRAANGR